MKQQYTVVEMDPDFVKYNSEYEQYALIYSKEMQKLFDTSSNNKENKEDNIKTAEPIAFGRYVKLCHRGIVIYRKCRAECHINSGQIGLGYRTQKELGLDSNNGNGNVCLKESNFLCYYLWNSDKYVALTAWVAVSGLLLTLISAAVSVLSLFFELPFCF